MHSAMLREIDQLGRFRRDTNGALENGCACARKRDDAAIVIGIAGAMQYEGARDGGDSPLECVNRSRIAALREVRNALDKRYA